MKKIVILGSTGSIGQSALRVVKALAPRIDVVGLGVNRGYRQVLQQAEQFQVRHVAVADAASARHCAEAAPAQLRVHAGAEGLRELATLPEADLVLCAVVGMAGLRPVLAAVQAGKTVALATKEVLVAAGAIVMDACRRHNAQMLPVDSEHSAIFQCLQGRPRAAARAGEPHDEVRRLLLTASGGPFAARPDVDLRKVTVAEALAHPRWSMGRKVTVDSATLMNKGLEIMEAHWLFGVPVDRVDVVIHPESIVHSMVEFVDGSVLAQMSLPDMRFAIQYALMYPERVDGRLPALDVAGLGALHFSAPDPARFPCLGLARQAAASGGTMPVVLNAANEVAVQQFLDQRIALTGIWRIVEGVMEQHSVVAVPSLEDIVAADDWARHTAGAVAARVPTG